MNSKILLISSFILLSDFSYTPLPGTGLPRNETYILQRCFKCEVCVSCMWRDANAGRHPFDCNESKPTNMESRRRGCTVNQLDRSLAIAYIPCCERIGWEPFFILRTMYMSGIKAWKIGRFKGIGPVRDGSLIWFVCACTSGASASPALA